MRTREDIERERSALRARFGVDYSALEAILFEVDPMGINFKTNTDEYDPEVRTILPRLSQCATAIDVQTVLHQEFCAWFGTDTAGPPERYLAAATRVFVELQHLMSGSGV